MPTFEQIESTKTSLEKIQDFDVDNLARTEDLGREMSLEVIVKPAQDVVDLYKKLSTSALEDFPDDILVSIEQRASADFKIFEKAREFKVILGAAAREQIINQVNAMYITAFKTLHQYISYSMHRATDFESLEATTRQFLEKMSEETESLKDEIVNVKNGADKVLEKVRAMAAEHGVTQKAVYFKNEADTHKTDADKWFKYSCWVAGFLALYAVSTFFFHIIPLLKPTTMYETIQFAISKVLMFGVLSYSLYFCSRNYFSHRHNYVVNKHRQNALVTYESIVKAAGDEANSDIILGLASSCIFSPQTTGYNGANSETPNSPGALLMKPFSQALTNSDN